VITVIEETGYTAMRVACGYQPHGIAVNDPQGLLYVLSRNLAGAGVPNHHGSICEGRNGFLSFLSLRDLSVKPGTYELSVDPYHIFARP
jgi:hypothetical protein